MQKKAKAIHSPMEDLPGEPIDENMLPFTNTKVNFGGTIAVKLTSKTTQQYTTKYRSHWTPSHV